MTSPTRVLQISSYPPPRAGWGVRVQYLRSRLEADGHRCTVLNTGKSRKIPSSEYETVMGGVDYVRKVWRFTQRGYLAHVHVNGKSLKGLALALVGELLSLCAGSGSVLTFHAGSDQIYFPRPKYPLLRPLFWLLFTMPRAIVCNDQRVKAKIAEYGVDSSKIHPIPAFSSQYLRSTRVGLPRDIEAFYGRHQEIVFCYINLLDAYHPMTALDGFADVAGRRREAGLVFCGVGGHGDTQLRTTIDERIRRPDLLGRVMLVEDLPHDVFLEAIERASVYLRTPPSDGVSSSVLEALSLRVPVVAARNDSRPAGVVTYEPADDAGSLASVLEETLERRDEITARMVVPEARDTLSEEVELLVEVSRCVTRGRGTHRSVKA